MSHITLSDGVCYFFSCSKKLVDFVNIRKTDADFMKKIEIITLNNSRRVNYEKPIVTLSDDFFYNMHNVKTVFN